MPQILDEAIGDIHAGARHTTDCQANTRLRQPVAGEQKTGWIGQPSGRRGETQGAVADGAGDPNAVAIRRAEHDAPAIRHDR